MSVPGFESVPTAYEDTRECGQEGYSVLALGGFEQMMIDRALQYIELGYSAAAINALQLVKRGIADVEIETPCPFIGDVAVVVRHSIEEWTCPLCRTEHQEEQG